MLGARPGGRQLLQLLAQESTTASPRWSGGAFTPGLRHPRRRRVQHSEREFKSLWLRFLSAVSALCAADPGGQSAASEHPGRGEPGAGAPVRPRPRGQSLAARLRHRRTSRQPNCSSRSRKIITSCSRDDEVKRPTARATCSRSIEQISSSRRGGHRNSMQKRVSANAGAIIIRWLADNAVETLGDRLR